MLVLTTLSAAALAGWLWLLLGRHGFWLARPVIEREPLPVRADWPEVVAIVPARNEAAHVGQALETLLGQDYPGRFRIILVDDHSDDETWAIGEALAAAAPHRLEVIGAAPLRPDWSGKLWALECGLRHLDERPPLIWFTDADIGHHPSALRRLVAKAEAERRDLVSVMVRLNLETPVERLLIPPFIFFFQMLYPFPAVNDPGSPVAAAAGGSALVRRAALDATGGLAPIRHRLIDDVALAGAIKRAPAGAGRIWLGHGILEQSLRRYDGLGEVWRMVARSADEQLGHSPAMLALTVIGMSVLYLVPVLAAVLWPVHGGAPAGLLGLATFALTMLAYGPTARLYRLGWTWRLTLPLAAALFLGMTLDSARRFRQQGGGVWKGRVQAPVEPKDTPR